MTLDTLAAADESDRSRGLARVGVDNPRSSPAGAVSRGAIASGAGTATFAH